MEYNTQREQLKITDYGRSVCKMIEYAKSLPDKAERTQVAHLIVEVMARVNPKVKERSDYKHTLWDHLMLMANYELDVDVPYPINKATEEDVSSKKLQYSSGGIKYRHYGKALESMIEAVAEMPDSEERQMITEQIAHTMKRQYLQWNRDTVDDDLIREQLTELSGGRLTLPADFQFRDSRIYLDAMAAVAAKKESNAKKKKKKKNK